MRLYHTNSPTLLGEQKNVQKSVGGYLSSSLLLNGSLNNLFQDITWTDLQKSQEIQDVKCLGLVNINDFDVYNVRIHTSLPVDALIELQLGVSSANSTGLTFERLTNNKELPLSVNFETYDSDSNTIVIDSMPANSAVGLWVKRTLKSFSFQEDSLPLVDIIKNAGIIIDYDETAP